MDHARIRQNGTRVLLEGNGKLVFDLKWQDAKQLADAIMAQALRAEEWDNAERIAMDQAVMQRAGVPISLSNHPAIKAEADKIAQWDTKLRRAMPNTSPSISSREAFGVPSLSNVARGL